MAVTIVCTIGVLVALVIMFSSRSQRREPVAAGVIEGGIRVRSVEQLRQICAVLTAGFVGGLLGFGLAGRLMMRLLAITSPDARGRLTDADEIVGRVTAGGTMFLVAFLTVTGIVGALAYHAVRSLLPSNSMAAGLLVGLIGGAILIRPSGLLDPGNHDFDILEPTWLAVLLCVAVIVVGACTTAVLVDRWIGYWPRPAWSIRGVAGLLPLVLCLLWPLAVAAVLIGGIRTLVASRRAHSIIRAGGRLAIGLAAVAGATWIVISGVSILR